MLNSLVRTVLARQYRKRSLDRDGIAEVYERLYQRLRRDLMGTEIGRDLGLEKIGTFRRFAKEIEPRPYQTYVPYINRILRGEADILFRGKAAAIGLTSGTTAASGLEVPYNEPSFKLFNDAQTSVARASAVFEPDIEPLRILNLVAVSAETLYEKDGIPYGYISGLLHQRVPGFLRKHRYPSDETRQISDWSAKIEAMFEDVRHVPLRAISGVPTVCLEVLKGFRELAGVKHTKEIWPTLRYVCFGGSDVTPVKAQLDEVHGAPLRCYGIYVATEAPVGLCYGPWDEGTKYLLNPNLLTTFIDCERGDVRTISEVEVGATYEVCVSPPNGFLQYPLSDRIRILSLKPFAFRLIGRANCINLSTERMTESDLIECLGELSKEKGIEIQHFMAIPHSDDKGLRYRLILFTRQSVDGLTEAVDRCLGNIGDQHYRHLRSDGAIQEPLVEQRDPGLLEHLVRKNAHRGQFKIKKIFQTEQDFDSYRERTGNIL